MGAALGVASVLGELSGTVCVIGTPAEELLAQGAGKIKLLQAGGFEGVDVALMMHPFYESRLMGGDLGVISCELTFHGRPAHAAVDPWNGANALDGLLLTFNNINALRQHLRPEIRVHGIISDGGQAPNIVPERASARLMVRARDAQTLQQAFDRIEVCARAGALASGTEMELSSINTVVNTRINATLNGLIAANFQQLGEPLHPDPLHVDGSTDFGNVSQQIPGASFWIKTHPAGVAWHSLEVTQAAGDEPALHGMLASACVLAGVALDLFGDSALLDQVYDDFRQG
jgi:amidohydrolase